MDELDIVDLDMACGKVIHCEYFMNEVGIVDKLTSFYAKL